MQERLTRLITTTSRIKTSTAVENERLYAGRSVPFHKGPLLSLLSATGVVASIRFDFPLFLASYVVQRAPKEKK
jgi:hypothetical protein